jgi:hypothetical protein
MAEVKQLSEFVLFGASMTEWSFRGETQGPGWFLEKMYEGKARIVNEGIKESVKQIHVFHSC